MIQSKHIRRATWACLAWTALTTTATAEHPASGIWISREEVRQLPAMGTAWEAVVSAADHDAGEPRLSDQDQMNNVLVLAKALVYSRTGDERYRREVRRQCLAAIGTERGGRTLALGRELAAYVVAADLVGLEPTEDERFRDWLRTTLDEDLQGKSLRSTHEQRPNNWGTHAGASRAAVAAYLDDRDELARTAAVFHGWLGRREAYADFEYGKLDWQSDPDRPRGINPLGAVKQGESIDGVIPDDMRRGGSFRFPPGRTNYPWGALEGAIVQAEILSRRGYDAWNWEDRALLRAVRFLYDLSRRDPAAGWWAEEDDVWMVWVVNRAYGTSFPADASERPGKNLAWTAWTHGSPR